MSGLAVVESDGSFWALLSICGFLCATWWASVLSRRLGVSSIFLEIATGVALGPKVLGLIGAEYSECEHQRHSQCSPPADVRQRLAQGLPLGLYLDPVARVEVCDAVAYGVLLGNLSVGAGASLTSTVLEVTTTGDPFLATSVATSTAVVTTPPPAASVAVTTTTLFPTTTLASQATTRASAAGTTSDSGSPIPGLDLGLAAGEANATEDANVTEAEAGDYRNLGSEVDDSDAASVGKQVDTPSSSSAAVADGRALEGGLEFASYEECLEKRCEAEVVKRCDGTPGIFVLIGRAGVALMLFESGMQFNFATTKDVFISASAVAVIGTILTLLLGASLTVAFGKPLIPDGIAVGTALVPTSVGMVWRLLGETGVLQESFGQVIVTAAYADDILSLLLLSILMSIGGERFDGLAPVVAPLIGVAVTLVAVLLAAKFWPRCITNVLLRMAQRVREGTVDHFHFARMPVARDEALFLFMLSVLVAYALATHFLGTHLWGCYLAGVSFARSEPLGRAHRVWVKCTRGITTWMVRIFFACTVAFTIPVGEILSFGVFLKGAVLGLCACMLAKVCSALWMEARWVIGWAMVGRAELSYLIAQMAVSSNRMDKESFAIVIWALLSATLSTPFVFRYTLRRYLKRHGLTDKAAAAAESQWPVSESEWEEEEHEQRGKCVASKEVQDCGAPDYKEKDLRDLEDIMVLECNPEREVISESPDKVFDVEAAVGAPVLQDMGDAKPPASTAKVAPEGKKRRDKRSRRGRTRLDKHVAAHGARSTRGMLCCLFFRKVVLD